MNTPRPNHRFFIVTSLTAAGIALATLYLAPLSTDDVSGKHGSTTKEKQPAYWVAPMDPNYRRDKPGKSPMGMDLVPVYNENGPQNSAGAGAIWISPEGVNNLGVRTAIAALRSLQPPSLPWATCSMTRTN